MIDIYVGVEWDIETKTDVRGRNAVTVHITVRNPPIEDTQQRVYYDFPKTTDGLIY